VEGVEALPYQKYVVDGFYFIFIYYINLLVSFPERAFAEAKQALN